MLLCANLAAKQIKSRNGMEAKKKSITPKNIILLIYLFIFAFVVKGKVKVAEKAKTKPNHSMDTIWLLQWQHLNSTFFNAAHAGNECRQLLEPKKIKHFLPLLSGQGKFLSVRHL